MGNVKNHKIKSFEQLRVWEKAQEIAVDVYRITKPFPESEKFGITSQIRRSSASISANIAEGFGRSTTKDKARFYDIAYGSLLETKNFIHLAKRLDYIDDEIKSAINSEITICQKQLNALIAAVRK